MFAFATFTLTELPEMSATDAFISVSEFIVKVTDVLLKNTVVAFENCLPVRVIVSLALAKDVLKVVITGK